MLSSAITLAADSCSLYLRCSIDAAQLISPEAPYLHACQSESRRLPLLQ